MDLIVGITYTALGEDRTGIVADMTKLVTDIGGNVGESRAVKLGSHFSLMMLVSVPSTSVSSLKDSLNSVTDIKTLAIETSAPHAEYSTPVVGCKLVITLSQ